MYEVEKPLELEGMLFVMGTWPSHELWEPRTPLGFIQSPMGSRKRGILLLCPAQVRSHLQNCPRRDLKLLERVQRRHQGDQRDGAALLGGKAGRTGTVHPKEEKLQGHLITASST